MRSLTWMTRRDVQLSGFRESGLSARGRNAESESQTTCGARARAVEFCILSELSVPRTLRRLDHCLHTITLRSTRPALREVALPRSTRSPK